MTMTLLPRGLKGHLGPGLHRYAQGRRRARHVGAGRIAAGPVLGPSVRVPRSQANLIKIVYWDGTGLCLLTKRLEQGVFLWPPDVDPGETVALSSEQLSMLIDGVDWRAPERRWRPAVAG